MVQQLQLYLPSGANVAGHEGHTGTNRQIHLNLWFLQTTRVHNRNSKSTGSAILHSSRKSVVGYVLSPNNCPFACGIWAPSNTCFLGPTGFHNPNGILIGSAVLHSSPQKVPIQCAPRSPKIAPFHGGCGRHLIHGSLGPPESSTQMASRSVQPFFCRAHYAQV